MHYTYSRAYDVRLLLSLRHNSFQFEIEYLLESSFAYLEIAIPTCIWVEIYDVTSTITRVSAVSTMTTPNNNVMQVFKIAKNVEKILQLHETKRASSVEEYGGPPIDYEPEPAYSEQQFVEYAAAGSESSDHLNCSRHSEVTTTLHSAAHPIGLQRPNSAPSFCYTFASLTNECDIPKANFHRRSASTAFKSIRPSAYGCTQFGETGRNDFRGYGNGCSAAGDSRMQNACLKMPTARGNVPEISVSNYDDCSECGTMERSSPKRKPLPRDGTGFLQIPVKRRVGGSESGYSTSSPSPDVACV